MRDEYKHYPKVERRLYDHRNDLARAEVLRIERKQIVEAIMPSVGVVSYGEHIGRASDTLTEPERFADKALADRNKLWDINRELDILEARNHIIEFAIAVLSRREREIVWARYFDGVDMRWVAEWCCYSERQCWRVKDSAIRKIGAVLFGE